MSGVEEGAALAAMESGAAAGTAGAGTAAAGTAAAGAGTAGAAGTGLLGTAGAGMGATGSAGALGGTALGAGGVGAGAGTGMAGALGSGMYGVPLAEGGSMLAGSGGVMMGGQAAGPLGSGLAGITMPTAAETATPWYMSMLDKTKSGMDYMNKANSAMKAVGVDPSGQKQARQAMQARPIFSGEQVQISPFGNTQDSGNSLAKMLMMKKLQANGLLG